MITGTDDKQCSIAEPLCDSKEERKICMRISLVVCTYMRPACIDKLLKQLAEMDGICDELIIVDASVNDLTADIVSSYSDFTSEIKYIRSEKGLTLQRNVALKAVTGDIIGFFDDDIIPDNDFFLKLRDLFKEHEGIYGITPYIYESNQLLVPGFKGMFFRFINDHFGVNYFASLVGKINMSRGEFSGLVDNILTNGCTFYRREIFDQFDFASWMEGYCFGEDMEFGLRVSQKYRLVGSGDLRLHHYHESGGRDNQLKVSRMIVYNYLRILESSDKGSFFKKIILAIRLLISGVINSLLILMRLRFRRSAGVIVGSLLGIADSLLQRDRV